MTKKIFSSGIFLRLQKQFSEKWGHMPPSPVPTALHVSMPGELFTG